MGSKRIRPDLNALSIRLVDDRPDHPYVATEFVPALTSSDSLVVFGQLPLRVR
ncbi:hypothetical protein [Natrinema caseinilyticum]|uniref:hypothetical protein n=1 Tax=Natrinema caseinilyticum TaxID=2961570 RepID=UPI0020C55AA9|nr:hypothetical protein [Natrinema caseinilyticum]